MSAQGIRHQHIKKRWHHNKRIFCEQL